jgi:hypothetical protein
MIIDWQIKKSALKDSGEIIIGFVFSRSKPEFAEK